MDLLEPEIKIKQYIVSKIKIYVWHLFMETVKENVTKEKKVCSY